MVHGYTFQNGLFCSSNLNTAYAKLQYVTLMFKIKITICFCGVLFSLKNNPLTNYLRNMKFVQHIRIKMIH